jgi:Asp-tRNA(Asn)/Glu-tRNA(Gln) amidotransferase A subunit family amidase
MPKPKLSRRRFIAGVAAGAAATRLPAPLAAADAVASAAAPDSLAAAEKLFGIAFTPAQRAPLSKPVGDRIAGYAKLRTPPLPNDVFPALTFSPAMAGIRPPTEPVVRLADRWQPSPAKAPSSEDDLAFLSVAQLAALLRSRQVTSRRLTELALARLKQFDSALSAVVTLTEARARQQADAADAELRAGKWRGPLHGIPWGAKDLLAVRGHPTTWGAAPYKDQHFDHDAEVVRRLDAAGAVLVAKLSLGALANGDQWFGGQTKCPWNLAAGSSGSSAGPCAAVSAGLVPFAIGSETLGSIVSPCTRNAVTGLRPTYGRVSRAGAMSLAWSMDKLGPIARSVEDCALIFDVIHGADPSDPTAIDAPLAWRPSANLQGRRVGFVAAQFEEKSEWFEGNQAALETLRRLGAELVPVTLPKAPGQALRITLSVEAAAAFDDLTLSGGVDDLIAPRPSNWAESMRAARYIPAVEYVQANRHRTRLVREIEDLFTAARLEACVTTPFDSHLTLTNLSGHPAVCVPSGFIPVKDQPAASPRRSATSVCFHARLYRDGDALAIAHAFQQATDFHTRRPPVV